MKRALPSDHAAVPSGKKRRIVHHRLHHKQERASDLKDLIDDQHGVDGGFIKQQMLRAIGVELKAVGFDGASPLALEAFRAQTEEYMFSFLNNVRMSMAASRRTNPIPPDFIFALSARQLTSSDLEQHFDTGPINPLELQRPIPPPSPPEVPPPDIEPLLGPTLSGRPVKDSKKYIPKHLPQFPSKHTWQATPVYTKREADPRKIREKATEDGILAEQALRKLMAANKAGAEKQVSFMQRQSKRRKKTDELWQAALKAVEEEQENREAMRQKERNNDGEFDFGFDSPPRQRKQQQTKDKHKKDEGARAMHVNYERKFWRKAAQEGNWTF
jgi:hypothetical protein